MKSILKPTLFKSIENVYSMLLDAPLHTVVMEQNFLIKKDVWLTMESAHSFTTLCYRYGHEILRRRKSSEWVSSFTMQTEIVKGLKNEETVVVIYTYTHGEEAMLEKKRSGQLTEFPERLISLHLRKMQGVYLRLASQEILLFPLTTIVARI